MCRGMLSNVLSCPENDFIRDCLRAGSPALISMFVDIAMVASQNALAVNLLAARG